MRRVTGLVLVGLGAFAFVLGLMVKFYGEPRMVRVPLNQVSGTKSVSDGNSTILDRGRVAIRSGLKLTANREVRGVVDGSKDDKTAVWRTASSLIGPAGETFRVTEERVAIDRVSGLAVNCCDEQLDGDRAVKHSGLVFKFPFDAERKTYPFWDATAKGAFPARYVGTEKRAGLDLYHFQSRVPETTISDVSVPPALVGREGTAAIEAEVVYTNTRDLWVEPRSGIIVEGREQPKQVLRAGDGSDLATVLEANIGYTPETVAKQADEAKTSAGKVFLAKTLLPVLLLVLGPVLILVGLLLLLLQRRRSSGRRRADPAAAAPAAAPDTVDLRDRSTADTSPSSQRADAT